MTGQAADDRGERSPLLLTFDDGPDPRWTPEVLDALRDTGAQATFFVLGRAVLAHPHLVEATLAAGHRVELHGHDHLDHREASADVLDRDTDLVIDALASVGVRAGWWRLPWGRPGPHTAPIAAARRLEIVAWDHDTHDWRGDGPTEQQEALTEVARSGGIVLLHDGLGPGADRVGVGNTLQLVDRLVEAAAEAGTPLRALPDPGTARFARLPVHPAVDARPEPMTSGLG